jgi:hypothetical protein
VAMSRSREKRPQDEHVQSSLENTYPLLCRFRHGRHSTLILTMMVDIRQSFFKPAFLIPKTKQGPGPDPRSEPLLSYGVFLYRLAIER